MKYVWVALIFIFSITVHAAEVKKEENEPTAMNLILTELVRKSTEINMLLDVNFTPGNEACIAKKGDKIVASLMVKDALKIDFAKPNIDPMFAMLVDAAEKGLMLVSEIVIGDNCAYNISAKFYRYDEATKKFFESNLKLKLKMGIAGQLVSFRVHNLASVLTMSKEKNAKESTISFMGELKADQELADFQLAALELFDAKPDDKEGISAPAVAAWYPADVKLIYKDGVFTVPIKSTAKTPTAVKPVKR